MPVSRGCCDVFIWIVSDLWISTDFFVNIAVQFSSQIRPTERRDPEASLLKTWAVVDALDRDGMGSVAVAMDCSG